MRAPAHSAQSNRPGPSTVPSEIQSDFRISPVPELRRQCAIPDANPSMRTRPPRSEPDSSVQGQTRKDAGRHDCTSEHDIAAYQPDHRQPGQPCREPARQPEGEEDGDERQCQQLAPRQSRHRYERNDVAEARGQSAGTAPLMGPRASRRSSASAWAATGSSSVRASATWRASPGFRALGLVNPDEFLEFAGGIRLNARPLRFEQRTVHLPLGPHLAEAGPLPPRIRRPHDHRTGQQQGPSRRARADKALRDAGSRCNAVVDVKNRCPSVSAEGFKIDPVDAAPHTQLTRTIEPSHPRTRPKGRGSSSVRLPAWRAHCQERPLDASRCMRYDGRSTVSSPTLTRKRSAVHARSGPWTQRPRSDKLRQAPLAQSAERLHGKEKVYGSIP